MRASISDWGLISAEKKNESQLKRTNPFYDPSPKDKEVLRWFLNCIYCVPTYEMRKRGFDVVANPIRNSCIAINPEKAWENPVIIKGKDEFGISRKFIEETIAKEKDGARFQICVCFSRTRNRHTFIAENRSGKVVFAEPQAGTEGDDVKSYFEKVSNPYTYFFRIDNLKPSELILECCDDATKQYFTYKTGENSLPGYSTTAEADTFKGSFIARRISKIIPFMQFYDKSSRKLRNVQEKLNETHLLSEAKKYYKDTVNLYYTSQNLISVKRDVEGRYRLTKGNSFSQSILLAAAMRNKCRIPVHISEDEFTDPHLELAWPKSSE